MRLSVPAQTEGVILTVSLVKIRREIPESRVVHKPGATMEERRFSAA
jgi:hypothetical protein